MSGWAKQGRRRKAGAVVAGAVAGAVTLGTAVVVPAAMASAASGITGAFTNGVLTVTGDAHDNAITVSRDAAGNILVNGGSVTIAGDRPTVANTSTIQLFGLDGQDTLRLDETIGALPKALLFGGAGNDTLIGGSGADQLFGQDGDDTLLGKGGNDLLFGGAGNDTLTGGTGDDQVFGQAGNDVMIWNPGEGTDLNEGGDGTDATIVNGGNGAENFTATPNGTRVRFDRVSPAPFSIDIGTTETLLVHMNGGDDTFTGSNGLAPLIGLVVDGGAGNDRITGGDGNDLLFGGDGNDFINGGRGNDTAFLMGGDDTFEWNPGDGSDNIFGGDGADTMQFNGANVAEKMDVSANGTAGRLSRDVGNVVMTTEGVETYNIPSKGGADTLTVNDMRGTDVTDVKTDLSSNGADDGAADAVIVNGTAGNDVVEASGQNGSATISGLQPVVEITGANPAMDKVTVNALGGDDVVEATNMAATAPPMIENGGDGDDVLLGGAGNDTLSGGNGDDILISGGGIDVLDGGPGNNIILSTAASSTGPVAPFANRSAGATTQGTATPPPAAQQDWLRQHVHLVDGKDVIENAGHTYTLQVTDLLH